MRLPIFETVVAAASSNIITSISGINEAWQGGEVMLLPIAAIHVTPLCGIESGIFHLSLNREAR